MKSIAPTTLSPYQSLAQDGPAAIIVRELSKAFNGRMVLDRISCAVPKGQFVVLLGPSGCGKSTLFRCLTRLVEPDTGTVVINGTEVTALKPSALKALRRQVGFVFQQFNLVKRFSAVDNVLAARLAATPLWRVLLRRFAAADRQLALACLDSVGLMDQAYQRAERLSGGQQQRVAIARAFAQQAELILADEPISSLDPESSENVLQILQRAAREQGFSVLCSLHQVDLAARYADRIIALRQGRLFFDGPASAFTPDLREELYRAARP
ncbi:phosphonate ABC transporter ATP-binding protein [Xanthobacter autotrophicus DSM 597]|uniref:phosphonate ABC transporter ATP-binding protein n=1 Tax=Xanthobacter wiegelii TaxID=3119913 RepID=UPI00372682FB